MKILYVTSEANPFAASGGLGDVMGALPKSVKESHPDYEVSVIMPLYDSVKATFRERMEKVADLCFKLSWRNTGATVYSLTESGVCYYFVENHYYFDRGRLYGEFDDAERFAFFSTAVVEFMLKTGNIPDILHANDWQSALTVIYLKSEYKHFESLCSIKTVYTIHNIEYQGKFDPYILGDVFGIGRDNYGIVEFDGCINLMKGALVTSDYITTVSQRYAEELKYDFFAFGLEEVIAGVSHKMTGIINGIDYGYFSPDKGGEIDFPYTKRGVKGGKAKNKKALLNEVGMSANPDTPLAVMITRLATQKGIELFLHIAEELLQENINVIVLGTGEKEYEFALKQLEEKFSNFKALLTFNRVLSKRLYASADMFLMPSKFEPCGLSQMISCSYGTIPVVRAVGGLYDSIIPYPSDNSNGFRFDNYNAHELLFATKYAIEVYNNKAEWEALRKRAMSSDFTWLTSAERYVTLYNNLLY